MGLVVAGLGKVDPDLVLRGRAHGAQSSQGGGSFREPAVREGACQYDMLILMSTVERITITLTAEMAQAVRGAVQAGEYASSSEIVREALRDWRHKRALQAQELSDFRAKIQEGLDDIEAGRVRDLDAERVIRQGKARIQDLAVDPARSRACPGDRT